LEYRIVVVTSFIPFIMLVVFGPLVSSVGFIRRSIILFLPFTTAYVLTGLGIPGLWRRLTNSQLVGFSPWDIRDDSMSVRRYTDIYSNTLPVYLYGLGAYVFFVLLPSLPILPLVVLYLFTIAPFFMLLTKYLVDNGSFDTLERIRNKYHSE
jgi:hypothetical protein